MATTTDAQQRAMIDLKTIALMLVDLPEVANEWAKLGEGERVSWSLDWSNEMSGLQCLAEYAREGLLTPGQEARLRDLLVELKAALPIVRRLNLYAPPVLLEA
jgi:hypothetical protein